MSRKQRRAAKAQLSAIAGIGAARLKPDNHDLLRAALRLHQSGKLSDAEELYRQILQHDPRHADALHLLGVIAHQVGRYDLAVGLIGEAIGINGRVAGYHANLGNVLRDLRRLTEAAASYRQAVCLKPELANAQFNLGTLLKNSGRLDDAIAAYHKALRLNPSLADAHCNLGNAYRDQTHPVNAVSAYVTALCIKPDYAEVYSNLGNALKDLGRTKDAVAAFDVTLRLKPDCVEALSNRGNALRELGRPVEAVAACHAALRLTPDLAEAHCNLGNAQRDLERLDQALESYDAALCLNPDYAEAHSNRGLTLLLAGRLREGWPEHEWRWLTKDFPSPKRAFPQPLWRGEDLNGESILLHAEQGMGDSLQFCRYASLVAARGGRVILEIHRSLTWLMRSLGDVDRIVATGDPLPPFDRHCPILSLPCAFDTGVESIPASIPYLSADPDRVRDWEKRLSGSGLRVGIVWQGNPGYKDDRQRSVPLACFAPLAHVPGVRLISLQRLHGLEQLDHCPPGMTVETLAHDFDSGADAFIDTAAVMMSLDLIITVDTAIAHLAGALGRPVWLPLARVPHWVWMLGRAARQTSWELSDNLGGKLPPVPSRREGVARLE